MPNTEKKAESQSLPESKGSLIKECKPWTEEEAEALGDLLVDILRRKAPETPADPATK